MSILVVEVLSEGIIFGADRNITYTDVNGSTTQGTSRSKVFKWPTERFLFGFVGAATVGGLPMDEWLDSIKDEFANITLAIIKVTSGYKFQTAAYRTDFS